MKKTFLVSLLVLSATACSKDDSNDNTTAPAAETVATVDGQDAQGTAATDSSSPQPAASGSDASTDGATETPAAQFPGAVVATEVDATNKTDWAYFDLDSGSIVASTDATWDLAFKRTSIKMNSTVTGVVLKDTTFDAVTATPEGPFAGDAPVAGGLETDGLFFHSPSAWYSYDMEVHVISSRNYVYVLKSNGGHDIKLAITDYYNVDRLPAFVQLKTQILGVSAAAE